MHGVPPAGLLISSLVPILKNKRGNKCDSENYRQIAISSIMEKLFDSIILEEQQDSLFTDLLQFGLKRKFPLLYGCFSPNLFSVYLNKLIVILKKCNIGCRHGNHYMGVYCYADDMLQHLQDCKKC